MDITELYVLILTTLPMATAIAILGMQRDRLGLFHVWLFFVAISYGAYTFVDVLVNGVAGIDEWVVTVLMFSVTASMFTTFIAFNSLPRQISYHFSVENLIREVDRPRFLNLFVIWSLVVAWHAYAYYTYGIVASYDLQTVEQASSYDIPTWVGPVRQLFIALSFSAFIWLVARIARKSDRNLSALSLIMLIAIVILLSLNGRRVFLYLLIVGTIVFAVCRGQFASIFSFRNVSRAAVAFAVLVVFSNIFQSIRSTYLVHRALESNMSTAFELVTAAFDFTITIENLKAREALWRFHYSIIDAQLHELSDVMGGELLWSGFLAAIPRLLFPNKAFVVGDDVLVCEHYSLICPNYSIADIDYPQTLLSGLQADFGFFSIVLIPLWILAVLSLVSYYGLLSRRGKIGPILYILAFGAAAELLVNVEQSVGNYFIWARDVAILTLSVGLLGFFGGLMTERQAIRR